MPLGRPVGRNKAYRVEGLDPNGGQLKPRVIHAQSPEHAARILREQGHLATKITETPLAAGRPQLPVAGRAAPGLQVQSPQGVGYHFPVGEEDARAAEKWLEKQGHTVVGGVNLRGRTPYDPLPEGYRPSYYGGTQPPPQPPQPPSPGQQSQPPAGRTAKAVTPFTLIRTTNKAGFPVTSVTHGPPDAAFERLGQRGFEYVSHKPLTVAQAAEVWRKMSDHLKRNKGEPKGGMKRFHVSVRTKSGPRTFRVSAPTAFSALGRLVDAGHTVTHVEPARPRRMARVGRPRKYMNVGKAEFHRAITDRPEENLNHLVYADWHEENGRPAHAEFIRKSIEQGTPFSFMSAFPKRATSQVDTSGSPYGNDRILNIGLSETNAHDPERELYWTAEYPRPEAADMMRRLAEEGADWYGEAARGFMEPHIAEPNHYRRLSRKSFATRKYAAGFGRSDEKHSGNAHIFDAVAKQLGIKQYNRNWPPYGKMAVVANELDRVGRYDESSLLRDGHDPDNPLFFDGQKVVRWTPDMADIDWRPNEVIPEDYYGYSRRKYAARKPDAGHAFVSALRRLRSKQQQALHGVAKEIAGILNLNPAVTRDALHDGPGGATPSIAQAVAGGDPETARYAAAWYGLLTRTPALGVFHVQPNGPDSAYKFTMRGSGEQVRQQLDRGGITPRVLLPRRDGWDVFVYDQGRRLRENVRAFAQAHGLKPEESFGKGETLGHADPAEARAKFRQVIMGYENKPRRMARGGEPEKYTVVIGRIPDTPDPGRRTARLASGRRAAFRAVARAILSPDGFDHALEWGGGVASAYRYPAESQFAVATASVPDGKIVLHHGWVGARNLNEARVGNIFPAIRPLYDSRYGDASRTRALEAVKAIHAQADETGYVDDNTHYTDNIEVGRIGIHPEVMNFLRKMSQRGRYDPNTAAILADWLQEHRGMSDRVADLIRRQSSLTGLLQVLHEHSLRPGSFAPSPAFERFNEPERMARPGRPARYHGATEDDFHAAIVANPKDSVPHHALSDHLAETGKPYHAEVIRRILEDISGRKDEDDPPHSYFEAENGEPVAIHWVSTQPGHAVAYKWGDAVEFTVRPKSHPNGRIRYFLDLSHSPREINELYNGLIGEGARDPSQPRRMSRRDRLVRYAAGEEDFHAAISQAPYAGHDMIYADWLEENGRPHTAEVIRHLTGQFHPSAEDFGIDRPSADIEPGSGWVNLRLPAPGGHLYWKGYVPKGRIGPLTAGMHDEGVSIDGPTPEAAGARKLARRGRPLRFAANFTLSPGRPGKTLRGEDIMHHDILDHEGQVVGAVGLQPRGEDLHVAFAGFHDKRMGENAGRMGVGDIRAMRRHVLAMYPGMKFFAGTRMSGTRSQLPMSQRKVRREIRRNMARLVLQKFCKTATDPYVVLYGRKGGRKSKAWISAKIRKLITEEKKPQDQAVAIALHMAGVPKKGS